MATNGSFRKTCIAIVLALLLLQGAIVFLIRPTILFNNRFTRNQVNGSASPSLGKPVLNKGPPVSISKLSNYTHNHTPSTYVSISKLSNHHTPSTHLETFSGSLTTKEPPTSTPSANYTLQPPDVSSYSNWKKGTFCEEYIGKTFSKELPVCSTVNNQSSLTCVGSSVSTNMARCTARFLAVEPEKLRRVVTDCDTCNISNSGSFHLIQNNHSSCPEPSLRALQSNSEANDPLHRSVIDITSNPTVPSETCHTWINKTAYFFSSQRYHIYFRLYSYYNLYKTLLDQGAVPGNYIVVRMSEASKYKFEDFERLLFPELKTLSELPEGRVCFREVVFSPWAYSAVMFRCKMERDTIWKCLDCEGRGKLGTSLMTFRTRALQACSLKDQTREQRQSRANKSIVFVKRKPYTRWNGDTHHNFQRVLSNQDKVVSNLKSHFPNAQVRDVFMEDLDLCEQMRLVHECDLYIGVHGAGLVHLWWLHDDATLLELAPSNFSQNPSFKTLAKLTGRRYRFLSISGSTYTVTVKIPAMMDVVKSLLYV
jgi:hypothetical protein